MTNASGKAAAIILAATAMGVDVGLALPKRRKREQEVFDPPASKRARIEARRQKDLAKVRRSEERSRAARAATRQGGEKA